MVKQEMIFGPFQGTTFTVITMNREPNYTRQEKNHSQFHFDTLTWPEQQARTRMWCLNAALTCIGISKETETDHIRGQGSHDSPFWKGNFQKGIHGPECGWRRNDIQAWLLWARDMERHVRSSATKRKTKVGNRKTESWQRRKNARYSLHWASGWGFQENCEKRVEEIGSSDASRQCLAGSGEERTRNLSQSWCSQDEIRMHRWSRRMYEKALGRNSTHRSWRPYCKESIH